MKLEEIKNTETWKKLAKNTQFTEVFAKIIRKCSYYVPFNELDIEITDRKIKLSFNSRVLNRDLDSQYKLFDSYEILLDDNYGYDFTSTMGGKLITNYSTVSYDENGVELFYQSYGDKYLLTEEEFRVYEEDLPSVVMKKYNPMLPFDKKNYPRPRIIGNEGRFLRRTRTKNNLGIVEVSKCVFDKKKNSPDTNLEYYFNTFMGTKANSPELIHIVNGFPFATVDGNKLRFKDDYAKLGLTDSNYQEVARERFLKELLTEREKHFDNNQNIINKYDMMIERIKKEKGKGTKTL